MCGIIGVLGNHEASPLLVEGLKRLEYRGYDSAGIATVHGGVLERRRAVGKLVNLSDRLVFEPLRGKAGIGHTRWATHGAPSEGNAHPHQAERVAVVHNGIVENFRELRAWLLQHDIPTHTDTDTETVALVCDYYLSEGHTPQMAAKLTIDRLEGAYALCFLFEGFDDLLIVARQGSPLAIGLGDGEIFVGSDAIALAPMTDQIVYLEEGDRAELSRADLKIFDHTGAGVERSVQQVTLQLGHLEKGRFKHFMMKEIHDQPTVLSDCLNHYTNVDQIKTQPVDFESLDRLMLVGCGTAYIAGTVAKYWFEQLANLPVDVDIASEFRYRTPPIPQRVGALFISQSGETADTLAALKYVQGKAEKVLSVVNVPESSIARESDAVFSIMAGAEIGVASTKAFMNQLAVLLSLAVQAGRQRGVLSAEEEARLVQAMRHMPSQLSNALSLNDQIAQLAAQLVDAKDVLFLGRGKMFPMAHEGALKLKEISYIHAEAYAAGELKHGPIALIDSAMPVVVLAPHDELFEKTVSNMQEVMARDGQVILLTDTKGAELASDGVKHVLVMPDVDPVLAPLLYSVPVQLLSYHTAVLKGTDVDQPRNLAKSVTVE